MQDSYTANTENNQESIEHEDTSRPGEVAHDAVTVDSDPRDVQLEMVRLNPPRRTGQKMAFAWGRMKTWEGKPFQVSGETTAKISTFKQLAALLKEQVEQMPPGEKFDAPALYMGVPRFDGSCKAKNFWFAQSGAGDLDGTIRSLEEYYRLVRFFEHEHIAVIILPTASCDPGLGIWRFRLISPFSISIETWEVYAAVGEWWMAYVSKNGLGIKSQAEARARGVDPCTKKPFQPMLIPRFPSEEIKAEALQYLRIIDGDPVRPDMERVRKELEKEKNKGNLGVKATTITVQDDGSIDRLGCALSDLSRAGLTELRPGEGRSDKGLWRAATIFRDWQVEQRKALAEMARIFGALGHDRDRIEHKIDDAYGKTDDPRYGCRLRAALAERPIDLAAAVAPQFPQADGPEKDLGPYKRGKSFFSTDWMTDPRPLGTKVLYRKSPQGTGKTESLKKTISAEAVRLQGEYEQAKSKGSQRIVIVVHRQALAKNLARRLGLPFYRDPQMSGRIEGSCVICLDSITRVALDTGDEDFWEALPVDILIVDESEQVVRHLFGDTCKKKFASIWSHLRELFRAAKNIILQDADLGQVTIEAARILLGWEAKETCDEHLEWNKWLPARSCQWQEDEATAIRAFLDAVSEGHHVAVYGDSKATIDALYEAAEAAGVSVAEARPTKSGKNIRITRDTSGSGEGADALENPNTIHEKYQVLLYTASANTGVSIDVEGVWRVFGFVRGGCGPTAEDVLQGLCRVRNPVGIPYVWVGNGIDNGIWWSTNPERNLVDLLTLNERTAKIAGSVGPWQKRYIAEGEAVLMPSDLSALRLRAIVMAAEARSKHMRSALRAHMEASGWGIEDVAHAPDEIRAEAKALIIEARELTEEEFVRSRVTATPKTIEQARADVEAAGTPEDHAALDAAMIRDFHGIPRTEPITEELVREDDHGRHRAQLRMLTDVHLFQEARDKELTPVEQMTAKQAAWAGAVRSALADPTGVTWDTRAQEAELIAVLLAMMGCQNIMRTAQEGKALVFPTLRVGPKTKDLIRRVLHATLPSDEALRRGGTDAQPAEGQNGTDESSKNINDSSVPISHKQWGYILRSIRGKTGLPVRSEQIRSGPDRGKRAHYIDLDELLRLLGQAKRYRERRVQGHDWHDPLIDQVCECRVTVEDLFEEWEQMRAVEPAEHPVESLEDRLEPADTGILEVLMT